MAFFTWNEDLRIGIEQIDNQHKKYFEMLSDLHEAVDLGKGTDVSEALFQELADYIGTHFSDEEALMDELNCPIKETQVKAHQGFIAKVKSLREKNTGNVSEEAFVFLRDWFAHHIMQLDKQIALCTPEKK